MYIYIIDLFKFISHNSPFPFFFFRTISLVTERDNRKQAEIHSDSMDKRSEIPRAHTTLHQNLKRGWMDGRVDLAAGGHYLRWRSADSHSCNDLRALDRCRRKVRRNWNAECANRDQRGMPRSTGASAWHGHPRRVAIKPAMTYDIVSRGGEE